MEFHADHELLAFIDDELVALHDRLPEVTATAVFETTSGSRRQLSSVDWTDCRPPRRGSCATPTTFESESIVVEFELDTLEPSDALLDAMCRTAQRVRLVLEPHLRLHLELERPRRLDARRGDRRSRHANP